MDTSFGLDFLCVLLACFNKLQVVPKNAVNPKGQENQKNRSSSLQLARTNLKRSGFVFVITEFKLKKALNTKQSASVFLMCMRLCKGPIAGSDSHRMTKRFGYFGAPKYHATAA